MRLFYGGRNSKDVAYLEDLTDWSPDLEVFLGLSRAEDTDLEAHPNAQKERITHFLTHFEFDENDEFYLCGNGAMVKSVNQLLAERGMTKEQVFQERFN